MIGLSWKRIERVENSVVSFIFEYKSLFLQEVPKDSFKNAMFFLFLFASLKFHFFRSRTIRITKCVHDSFHGLVTDFDNCAREGINRKMKCKHGITTLRIYLS